MENIKNNINLVCLSPSPSNKKVIDEAYKLSENEGAKLVGLYVCPRRLTGDEKENKLLQENLDYAEKMGAMLEIIYADDVAGQIINFAKLHKIKRIILGKNIEEPNFYSKKSICDQVLKASSKIDVYMVPVEGKFLIRKFEKFDKDKSFFKDFLISILVLVAATLTGYLFSYLGFDESNVIMIYILGVFFIALITYNEYISMISSVLCVLAFNFYFTQPTMSLSFYNSSYLITFFVLLIVSFVTSRLASRIRKNAENSSKMIFVTELLLETNQLLQTKISKEEIIDTACSQLSSLLKRDIVYYDVEGEKLKEKKHFSAQNDLNMRNSDEEEVAAWVLVNNKGAGAATRYLPSAKYQYFPLRIDTKVYGIVGIYLDKDRLDSVENKILLAILGDMSLALEKEKILKDKNEVALKVKDEQLKSNLLRSISHDLRTPLTTICGNSDILLHESNELSDQMKLSLYRDIYDDSQRLLNLIENLLSITKVEDGSMKLKMQAEMVEEVVDEALKHISRDKKNHKINFSLEDEYLMAKMDARLIIQVIINLIDNAIKYTKKDSTITIKAYKKDDYAFIEILDDGEGIRDEDKEKVFQKFYSVSKNKISDSRRSIGLGLYLCKIIVEAHGGKIWLEDNKPRGARFILSLKAC